MNDKQENYACAPVLMRRDLQDFFINDRAEWLIRTLRGAIK